MDNSMDFVMDLKEIDLLLDKNHKTIDKYFRNVITNGFESHLFELFDNFLLDLSKDKSNDNPITMTRVLSLCSQFNQLCHKSEINSNKMCDKSNDNKSLLKKFFDGSQLFGSGVKCLAEMRKTYGIGNKITTDLYNYCVNESIKKCVKTSLNSFTTEVNNSSSELSVGQWVVARSPARIDLQGGWSDLPPICYEMGGSVVNLAVKVNDQKPIGAKARKTKLCSQELICIKEYDLNKRLKLDLKLNTIEEFLDFCEPDSCGALIKSALICCQIIDINKTNESLYKQLECNLNSGLEIELWSHLPQGSGLGTSSILLGCVIAVLWTLSNKKFSKLSLINAVLYSEQLLTSGGGWQDQVGGIIPGLKIGLSHNSLPLRVEYKAIEMNDSFRKLFENHLMLIYSGTVRLARDLVQKVIQNWYIRDQEITDCFHQLLTNSSLCLKAFIDEDLEAIGELLYKYREQKKVLAPNSEPIPVSQLFQRIEPYIYGGTLCGAGGGGFLCLLVKDLKFKNKINSFVEHFLPESQTYDCLIDEKGFELYVNEIEYHFED